MKPNLSLALAAAAALAALAAYAQPSAPRAAAPQDPTPIERLERLEQQVGDLTAKIEALQQGRPAVPVVEGEVDVDVEELSGQMEEVLAYLAAQAQGAQRLEDALVQARDKGFTWGINPDSRIVLLAGFGQFISTLKADVPGMDTAAGESTQARR